MSVKRQTTTYRCDGCGYETEQPYNWRRLVFVGAGTEIIYGSGFGNSEDFCDGCVQKMRACIKTAGNE